MELYLYWFHYLILLINVIKTECLINNIFILIKYQLIQFKENWFIQSSTDWFSGFFSVGWRFFLFFSCFFFLVLLLVISICVNGRSASTVKRSPFSYSRAMLSVCFLLLLSCFSSSFSSSSSSYSFVCYICIWWWSLTRKWKQETISNLNDDGIQGIPLGPRGQFPGSWVRASVAHCRPVLNVNVAQCE